VAYVSFMVKWLIIITPVFLLIPVTITAQAMDNSVSFRYVPGNKYFRINYENDFFTASDRDYTQGILVEKVHPGLNRFPLMRVLWHPGNCELKYGLAIEHNAYTPNQIDKYAVQYGDRPYAGALLFKTFLMAVNYERKKIISVSLSTGLLGPGAGGEQMQRTIHHWIRYTQPEGWHNQIQNDLILNYQLNIEREIYQYGNYFFVSTYGSAKLGTLSDKLSAGFTVGLGNYLSPFTQRILSKRPFQWHLYCQLLGNLVGYDATLQGGVFNHSSIYTIAGSELNRLTIQNKFGIVLIFKSVYLEYYRTGTTEEFKTSLYHRTGGLQIGFGF
jgi:lipid A 3-O-deacylase